MYEKYYYLVYIFYIKSQCKCARNGHGNHAILIFILRRFA